MRWISAHKARVGARPLSGLTAAACALAALAAAPAHAATTLVINPFAHTATPKGVAVDPATGDVYIADATDNEVFKVSPAGAASVLASGLNAPNGVAVDPSTGDVYIADTGNHEVKRLSANGTLSVVAGTGTAGAPTPGPATASALGGPAGLAVDSAGNLYIADGTGASANPYVETVTSGGTLSILAGNGTRAQPVARTATSSPLRTPTGVALDPSGNVFIADAGANVVAKVTPAGVLSIFAGRSTGLAGQPTTGTATNSRLSAPTGLATDGAGNLYIADTTNNRVEEVTPADRLSIFAGTGTIGAPSYGSQASLSPLNGPAAIALTGNGFTYVANATHATVDRIAPALPALSAAPTPTGTTTQGQTLTATSGTWANAPTAYAYGWERCDAGGAACATIAGATAATYAVIDADRGQALSCTVIATNAGGAIQADSARVTVPRPVACPTASGIVSGSALGPLQLGDTRSQARLLLPRYSAGSRQDSFCLAGGQSLRAVYASPSIVKTSIARADRAEVSGRIALILTATRHYAIHGIHPGTRARPRGLGQPLRAGGATWYVIRGARANGIIEVRRGTVVAVGIADTRLSATRAAAMRLLRAAAA